MKVLIALTLVLGAAMASVPLGAPAAQIFKQSAENFDKLSLEDAQITINALADLIIEQVRSFIIKQGFDPMRLPDIHESFSFTPIIITYHGELDLTNGWLQDSSTLYRGGDVVLTINGKVVTAEVPLNFKDFLFDYQYSAKLMGIGPTGDVDGKVTNIEIYCRMTFDFENMVIILDRFKVADTGKIDINFHGNPLVDWLANIMADVITTIFRKLIEDIAENIIGGIINDILDVINGILGGGEAYPEMVNPNEIKAHAFRPIVFTYNQEKIRV